MNIREAYNYGKEVGYGIGMEARYEISDYDNYLASITETECEYFRQFSPFEFYAKEFNNSHNPDITWEAYELGVVRGAILAWKDK